MRADVTDAGEEGPGGWAGWIAAEQGRFVIWLPVFMAAGVVWYDSVRAEPAGWAGALVGAVGLLGAWFGRGPWLRVPGVAVVAVALGIASAQWATWRAADLVEVPTRATIVTGVVRAVEQLPQGRRITIEGARLDGEAALRRSLRLRLKAGDEVALATGDTVRVRAMLSRPAPPAYPGAWDLQRDAFYSGIGGFGFALNPAERVAEGVPGGWGAWMQGVRERIIGRVNGALAGERAAIAATLMTGGTASIAEADRAAFRDSGLAHLLAIAGLHIGIVMAWVFGTTRLGLALSERAALHWPLKAIAAVTALVAGGAYMLLTGAHVPIIRSFAMACLVTLGVVVGRRALSLRGLALAMAALILIAPHEVMGVSFQMSFSAVLALVAGYAALRPWLARLHGDGAWYRRLAGHVVALGLTSALAGTASMPYGAFHFGHVQLYYVFANMVAVPLTALWVMPAGMLAMLAMPLGLEWAPLWVMGWGIEVVLAVGRTVAAWPAAVVAVPHMAPWGLVVLSLGIAWLGIWRTQVRLLGLVGIVVGAMSPLAAAAPDVLVSAEGRLIAFRTAEGAFVQQTSGGSRFTREAWLQFWAITEMARIGPATRTAAGAVLCAAGGCAIRVNERLVTLARGRAGCEAALVVAAEPVRLECGGAVPVIDRFSVWREGAHAAWVGKESVRVVSDRQYRGQRPWMPPVGRSRIPPGLPAAAMEDLGAD